jgi:hypothetical protein
VEGDNTPNLSLIAKFVAVYALVNAQANLASHSFRQKYQLVKSLLCLPPEKVEVFCHLFFE